MIIDKQQLTELLMDKTDLDKEQVESQLSELVKRIRTAAEEGKTFEIESFGTFSMRDEELQFNPGDRLKTEINNKYAGMKPIELIGAFKEPDGDEIPDMPEEISEQDGVWAFDDEAEEVGQEEQDSDETEEEMPAKVQELIDPTASNEKAQEAFEELINQNEDKSASQTSVSEPSGDTEELDKRKKSPADPLAEEGDESKEQDLLGRVLVTVVAVLVIGVTGFLIYDIGGFADDFSNAPVASNKSVEQAEMAAGSQDEMDQQTSSSEGSEPEQSKEVLKSIADVEKQSKSEGEQQKRYGLRGKISSSSSNSYTIVVHSLRNRSQAENRKQDLNEDGFRTLINEANVQGTMYYRVGIGQFATIKTAQDAIDDIPERYKSDHFIKRIQ